MLDSCRALKNIYGQLKETGTTRDHLDQLVLFNEFNELMGVEQRIATEERLTQREGDKLRVRVRAPTKPV
jgi:hypothetical protein